MIFVPIPVFFQILAQSAFAVPPVFYFLNMGDSISGQSQQIKQYKQIINKYIFQPILMFVGAKNPNFCTQTNVYQYS